MLNHDQQKAEQAFIQFLANPNQHELTICGHAGTGKTYLVKHLLNTFHNTLKAMSILTNQSIKLVPQLTATTHKAAKALKSSTNTDVKTIHSFLGLSVYNDYKTGKTRLTKSKNTTVHKNILLFIDESSMIDFDLQRIIRECTINCKIVYILDHRQLLPIYASNNCPVYENVHNKALLKSIMRQAADNPIIQLADMFRQSIEEQKGIIKPIPTDLPQIRKLNGSSFKEAIINSFTNSNWNPDTSKILAYSNDRVNQYNNFVRKLHTDSELPFIGESLVTNSPVMDPKGIMIYPNEYEVTITQVKEATAHGIPAYYLELDSKHNVYMAKDSKQLTKLIKSVKSDGNFPLMFQIQNTFANLRSNYACTVHKSQGSTYENVFIDLSNISECNVLDTVMRLVYVAFTRASSNVYYYGDLKPEQYFR